MPRQYSRQQFVRVCDCGCGDPTTLDHRSGLPHTFMRGHNNRVAPTKRMTPNAVRVDGDVAYIALNRGLEAIIDAADLPRVTHLRWTAAWSPQAQTYYVWGKNTDQRIALHRLIMDAPEGMFVDHKHHDGLNNRRGNLRVVTPAQNGQNVRVSRNNTTGVRGVTHLRSQGIYRAQVYMPGRKPKMKAFPLTPEGLQSAATWVKQQRAIFMPYSDPN